MKQIAYQQKAIAELTEKVITLLNTGEKRRKIVFKAPTGSGKTVMACEALAQIVDALHDRGDSRWQEVAFIWFAPRKLHLQSYSKLRLAYEDNRRLSPVMFDELDQVEGIQSGEILFVNWESVNKDTNIMARESESSASIYEVARRTREELGLPIVVIIDEEHMFWNKTADKSKQVLDRINPNVEIRISATPKTISSHTVTIERYEVIEAEMIKREVVLNPEINEGISDEQTLNEHLLRHALTKRKQLAEAYRAQGTNINPLLLIQLPNDSEKTNSDDERIAEQVKVFLSMNPLWGISAENGKLAVWLAGEKTNLDGLEQPDSMVEVLLFKEAIALGWDCPRAAVLLIFRKLQSDTFTIQTVGRILRMPEQRHYPDGRLNVGYVYTDIAKDKIQIVAADASYIHKNAVIAYRRKELNNVILSSTYSERPNAGRNYLGPDFKRVLMETAIEFFKIEHAKTRVFSFAAMQREEDDPLPEKKNDELQIGENCQRVKGVLRLDVKTINAEIPVDVHFQNEEQIIEVDQVKYARTDAEIDRVFLAWVNTKGGQFESKGRTDKIANYLLEVMGDLFGVENHVAKKIILYRGSSTQPNNRQKFDRILELALQRYANLRHMGFKGQARRLADYMWQVPEERVYDSETHHIAQGKAHALLPFYELNAASNPEVQFAAYLEAHRETLDWWYKNGDNGKQHYAIRYENSAGQTALFYVDFVIRSKSGKIYLFDTKGTGGDIDPEVVNKHNALIDYIAAENAKGKNLHGGVIKVNKDGNWLYSPFKIDNADNLDNWTVFDVLNV